MTDSQLRQMRDFLDIFNKIAETCFNHCVHSFGERSLTPQEMHCVDNCTGKFLYSGQSVMQTYVEVQPEITERRIKEMNKWITQSDNNPPGSQPPPPPSLHSTA